MQRAIERSAGRLGLASQRLPSGAGHDAQMMAQLSPMGMIFVPSVKGISHSPHELTNWTTALEERTSCSPRCWKWITRSYFFSSAVQLTITVSAARAGCSTTVLTRNRWPSIVTA